MKTCLLRLGKTVPELVLWTIVLCSCASSEPRQPLSALPVFDPETLRQSEQPGCEAMLDEYCDSLFSPVARGNIRIGKTNASFPVFRGKTENDFSTAFYFYMKAKLDHRQQLPKDFRRHLEQQGYFTSLAHLLSRPPRRRMSLEDRLADTRRSYQTVAFWNAAIEETVLQRLHEAQPQYHRLSEEYIPVDLAREKRKVRRKLISQISSALWGGHQNWTQVEENFEQVRSEFITLIDELDLDEPARKRWKDRVGRVKLVLPGSLPEIADEECMTTSSNAYYFPDLNVITVCAGDFNSEPIYQTIAHELAHAVDVESMGLAYRQSVPLGQKLQSLEDRSCGATPFSCSDWDAFKSSFQEDLGSLSGFSPDLEPFQSCLKSRRSTRSLGASEAHRIAQDLVSQEFARLADDNAFVRLTKPELPLPDGQWMKNSGHLNVCKYLSLEADHDLFDVEEAGLLFFVSEYHCASGTPAEKLRQSIAQAREMVTDLKAADFLMMGSLSDSEMLNRLGFAASPAERFADVLGSHLFARVLGKMADRSSRRMLYFASSTWQCPEPSLHKAFPEESQAEKELTFDAHSTGRLRQRENLSEPIRKALNCTKDFSFKECRLPYKDKEEEE